MKCTIKALTPVYKAYVGTMADTICKISEILSVNLNSPDRYNFVFTFEYRDGSDINEIIRQVKLLLGLYGSTILSVNMEY